MPEVPARALCDVPLDIKLPLSPKGGAVSNPKYRPRDFAVHPALFGNTEPIEWLAPSDDISPFQLRAARIQHLYAVRIRARLEATGTALKSYAVRSRVSYDRTSKMLRGEVVMRLEDIAIADVLLGEVSEWEHRKAEFEAAKAKRAGAR